MIISKITTQKKAKNRYNIFEEKQGSDLYAFSIHEDLLVRFEIRKGLELTNDRVEEIKQQDALYKYYTLSLNFLSYRMRAKSEIFKYLEQKEATEDEIKTVLNRLEEEKLVDDLAFAQAFVRTKVSTASGGPNKVRQELKQKQIPEEFIEQAISNYSFEDEVDKAHKLLQKKLNSSNRKSFQEQLNGAKQTLMQKGYSFEAIQAAIDTLEPEVDEEEEWQAVVYQGEKAWRKYERKHEGYTLQQKVKASLYQKGFNGDLIKQFIEEKVAEG
ncbi:recombination regulator RecX [Halalkalibacillus halophilus]|uniref:recombination regulator RecX n=1 Tax=Halalkalibacillus halophilus TaxID=392827 RepID=UPI0004220226|nr:recombination regulator RecX [Halalkalibacillus halophilus]